MAKSRPDTKTSVQPPGPRPGGPRGMMGPQEQAKNRRGTLQRLWGYLSHQGWTLVLVTVLVAVGSGLNLAGPYLMGRAIDVFIAQNDLPGLGRLVLLMIAVYLVASGIAYVQTYLMAAVAQRTVRDLRADLFERLQSLPLRYFDSHPHGELMSRLTNDIENISNVLNESVTQLISSVLSILGVAIVMFLINVPLAVISLVILPLMMVISRWVAKRTRIGFRRQQEQIGRHQWHDRGDDHWPAGGQGLWSGTRADLSVRRVECQAADGLHAGANLWGVDGTADQFRQ